MFPTESRPTTIPDTAARLSSARADVQYATDAIEDRGEQLRNRAAKFQRLLASLATEYASLELPAVLIRAITMKANECADECDQYVAALTTIETKGGASHGHR